VVGADIDTNPDTQEAKVFRVLFNDFIGAPELSAPPQWSANAFDAVTVLALAIQRAGSIRERERLRDAIFDVSNDGPGKTSFGPSNVDAALKAIRRGDPVNYTGASGRVEMDDFGVVANRSLIWRVSPGGAFETIARYSEEEPEQVLAASRAPATCP
jgi:ABC-type branched-subunit amino acid transport system substrate-binding protein